jgi:hypothetical protein
MAFPFSLLTNITLTRGKKIVDCLVEDCLNSVCHFFKYEIIYTTRFQISIVQRLVNNPVIRI